MCQCGGGHNQGILCYVTTNTIPGIIDINGPLWARGQDALLVIRRLRDRARLATQWLTKKFGNLKHF